MAEVTETSPQGTVRGAGPSGRTPFRSWPDRGRPPCRARSGEDRRGRPGAATGPAPPILVLVAMLLACTAPEPLTSPSEPDAIETEAEEAASWIEADAQPGRAIAERVCARCHALDDRETSPHPAAPPFPRLARRLPAERLLPLLEEGIRAVHPDMPEIRLAPSEIDPFLAFWSTL